MFVSRRSTYRRRAEAGLLKLSSQKLWWRTKCIQLRVVNLEDFVGIALKDVIPEGIVSGTGYDVLETVVCWRNSHQSIIKQLSCGKV